VTTGTIKGAEVGVSNLKVFTQRLGWCSTELSEKISRHNLKTSTWAQVNRDRWCRNLNISPERVQSSPREFKCTPLTASRLLSSLVTQM